VGPSICRGGVHGSRNEFISQWSSHNRTVELVPMAENNDVPTLRKVKSQFFKHKLSTIKTKPAQSLRGLYQGGLSSSTSTTKFKR